MFIFILFYFFEEGLHLNPNWLLAWPLACYMAKDDIDMIPSPTSQLLVLQACTTPVFCDADIYMTFT